MGRAGKVSAARLGALLFPGCRTVREADEAARSEGDATARNLWVSSRRLMQEIGTDDVLDLYRRPDDVVGWVSGRGAPPAAASKLTFYSALAALANPRRFGPVAAGVPPRASGRYRAEAARLREVVRAEQESHRLDPRERAAILPWPEIVALYRRNRASLSDSQAVIAALYLAGGDNPAGAPRRLDYNAVRVFDRDPAAAPPGLNYVVVRSPADVTLVLQEFKTSKHYGPYRARLPAAVARVLHDSLAARPRRWLVHDEAGEPLSPSSFGRRVAGTTRKLTGRAIGASNLRKSFVTWLYSRDDLSPERLRAYAAAMNHSPAEQGRYCREGIESTVPDGRGGRGRRRGRQSRGRRAAGGCGRARAPT